MKRLLSLTLTAMLVCLCFLMPAHGMENVNRTKGLVEDEAYVLTQQQLDELNAAADQIAEEYQMEVAVAIVPTLGGWDSESYADDYYDYNGYGYGENDDGILLLIAVEEREYWITCHARGSEVFTYGRQDSMADSFLPYLADNDWYGAARQFLSSADRMMELDNKPKTVSPVMIVVDLLLGLLLSGAPMAGLKAQLNQVHEKRGAGEYIPDNGVDIFHKSDVFLHKTVTRTPVQKRESSSRGGRHTSSSGRSHTGSGGRF